MPDPLDEARTELRQSMITYIDVLRQRERMLSGQLRRERVRRQRYQVWFWVVLAAVLLQDLATWRGW